MKLNFNFNTIVIIATLIIAAVAIGVAWHFYDASVAATQKTSLITAAKNDFLVPVISTKKDTAGVKHNTYAGNANTFTPETIKSNPDVSLGGADTAAKAVGVLKENIQYWTSIAQRTMAENLVAKKLIDSLKRKVLYYQDKFIKISYYPGIDTSAAGSFSYANNESLSILNYWKRSWFLAPKRYYLDISSNNPNTTIEGLKSLTIQPITPWFNLKGQVRTSYDFATGHVIPAAGIEIDLGRFEISGRYYYSPTLQKLEPIVSGTYNLFKLN